MGKIIQRLLAITRLELASNDLIPVQDVSEPKTKAIRIDELKKAILDSAHPVGTIYSNELDSRNPAEIFGIGTWVAMPGYTIVGYDESQSEFNEAGKTGGAKTHNHKGYGNGDGMGNGDLRAAIGAASGRADTLKYKPIGASNPNGGSVSGAVSDYTLNAPNVNTTAWSHFTPVYGYTSTSSSLMPYTVAYVWKRIA